MRLLETAAPPAVLSERSDESLNDLIRNGQVAMWTDYGLYTRSLGSDFATAVAPLPTSTTGVLPSATVARGLYIARGSQHSEQCWRWMSYLSEQADAFRNEFPARTSVATSDAFRAQTVPGANDVYDALGPLLAQSTPQITHPSVRARLWLNRAVEQSLKGGNAERELAEAQRLTEELFACIRGGGEEVGCVEQVDPNYVDGQVDDK